MYNEVNVVNINDEKVLYKDFEKYGSNLNWIIPVEGITKDKNGDTYMNWKNLAFIDNITQQHRFERYNLDRKYGKWINILGGKLDGDKFIVAKKDDDYPHELIEIEWGGAFYHGYRGIVDVWSGRRLRFEELQKVGALYYNRVSSHGGGLGSDWLVVTKGWKMKYIKFFEE